MNKYFERFLGYFKTTITFLLLALDAAVRGIDG
jgi:hypothetical protein